MKPDIAELRDNPHFIEELGTWKGWMTPLKAAHKTHELKIEHPQLGPVYLRYVPGDYIICRIGDGEEKTLREPYEFEWIQKLLNNCVVEFVRRE